MASRQNYYAGEIEPVYVQLDRMIVPWFWVGWSFDNTLQMSGNSGATLTGEYITEHTAGKYDYWFHQKFMTFMVMLHQFGAQQLHPEVFDHGFVTFYDGSSYLDESGALDPTDPRAADFPRFQRNLVMMAKLVFGSGSRSLK